MKKYVYTPQSRHKLRFVGLDQNMNVKVSLHPCKGCGDTTGRKSITNPKSLGYELALCRSCHEKHYASYYLIKASEVVTKFSLKTNDLTRDRPTTQKTLGNVWIPSLNTVYQYGDQLFKQSLTFNNIVAHAKQLTSPLI